MRLGVILALAVLPAVAAAQTVDMQLHNQVPAGQKPTLTVTPVPGVAKIHVEITRQDDHKTFTVEHGAIREGAHAVLALGDGRPGRAQWTGKLVATYPDGNRQTFDLKFESMTIGELKVTYNREHLDLDAHTLEVQLSRPAARAELTVIGDDGGELGRGSAGWKGEPPGTWLRVAWTPSRAGACAPGKVGCNVLRLELRVESTDGLAALVKLMPWAVAIPHDEVVFPTGQATLAPSEVAKLDASYQKIVDAVATVRKAEPQLAVRLFIAGHTDTVGGAADNRKLSLERARAIAAWFRDRGLPLPIAYAGFGEDALKVKTPDNTDEQANRRADYIVGAEEPMVARGVHATWMALK